MSRGSLQVQKLSRGVVCLIFLGVACASCDELQGKQEELKVEGRQETLQFYPALVVGEKWGYIDRAGKMVIKPQFDEAKHFYEGLAAVKVGKKWGFVDHMGKFIAKPRWDKVGRFSDGMARVGIKRDYDPKTNVMHCRWGYIDRTGKVIVKPKYDYVSDFSDNIAFVEIDPRFPWEMGKSYFIDRSGRKLFKGKARAEGPFSEGLALARLPLDKEKEDEYKGFGYIDKTGTFVIPPQFKHSQRFSDGVAVVDTFPLPHPTFGRIVHKNGRVVKISDRMLGDFSEGLCIVSLSSGNDAYMDKTGKVVIEGQPSWRAYPFQEGLALVEVKGKDGLRYGFIDKTGQFAIEPQFREAESFHNGLAYVDGRYIDKTGKFVWKSSDYKD